MSPVPQLVIFDCDGVLVDSEVISNSVLAQMLTAEGLATTLAEARRDYQGRQFAQVLACAEQRLGRRLAADWPARYERARDDVFRRELEPVAGAADAVRRLQGAGVKVCVASQGKLTKTHLSLGLTGLARLLPEDVRFSAESVARGKPAPDLFLHAASEMGVAPGNCAVVEDTPLGVAAAVSAHMRALGFAADSDPRALQAAGAEIFHRLVDLPGLVGLD